MADDTNPTGTQVPTDAEIEAEIAQFWADETEEMLPVVLAVPNGNGFIPLQYQATTTTLMQVQALLERGTTLNVPQAVAAAKAAILGVVKDESLAEQLAAHLVEKDLIKVPGA